MLVLTRQRDQSILIGDDVKVKVLDIRGGMVRLGIEAPEKTRIVRQEVLAKIAGSDDNNT